MILEVETTEIMDIRVEVVPADHKIGAFVEDDFEQTEEEIVRPIFKCKLSDRHKASLGGLDYVWVDATCLAADSGNIVNAMQFATSRKCQLTTEQSSELEMLLYALVSVSGSSEQIGDGDQTGTGDQKPQTENQQQEE